MKNIVMIAYPFPPEGAATSYRTLRHVRQLPKMGWSVQVISAVPSQYERYDPKLLGLVPKETPVIRVRAFDWWQRFQSWRALRIHGRQSKRQVEPKGSRHEEKSRYLRSWIREMVQTVEAWWYHPDMAMPWIRPAVGATLQASTRQRPTVIWANAGRVSAFFIAQKVSRHIGVPYILDFDDAWTVTCTEFEARKSRSSRRLVRRTMYELLKGAQAVVFRYESEAECFWRAYKGALQASKVYIIPNGFEAPVEPFVSPPGDMCTILYAGTLPDYRYDTLLTALTVLRQTDPVRTKQMRLLFVGEGMQSLAAEAESLGLTGLVQTAGPTSYAEIVRLQQEAHALLVLGRKATIKGYELFAGAKLFGYLKAGRPILGVVPQDETRQALLRVGARTVADVDSVPEIVAVLQNLLEKWSKGELLSLVPDPKACASYSSEHQTAILVRALEGVPPEKPFVPGAQGIPLSLRHIEDEKWIDGIG